MRMWWSKLLTIFFLTLSTLTTLWFFNFLTQIFSRYLNMSLQYIGFLVRFSVSWRVQETSILLVVLSFSNRNSVWLVQSQGIILVLVGSCGLKWNHGEFPTAAKYTIMYIKNAEVCNFCVIDVSRHSYYLVQILKQKFRAVVVKSCGKKVVKKGCSEPTLGYNPTTCEKVSFNSGEGNMDEKALRPWVGDLQEELFPDERKTEREGKPS